MKYLIAVNDLLGTPLWLTDDPNEAATFESEESAEKLAAGLVMDTKHIFTTEEHREAVERMARHGSEVIEHLKNQFDQIQKQIQDPKFVNAAMAAGEIVGDNFYQTLLDTTDQIAKRIDEATKKQKQNVAWLKYYREKKDRR